MCDDLEEKPKFERLPSNVVPVNYRVELRPNLNVFTFYGKLEISAKVATNYQNMFYVCILTCLWLGVHLSTQ